MNAHRRRCILIAAIPLTPWLYASAYVSTAFLLGAGMIPLPVFDALEDVDELVDSGVDFVF